MAQWVTRWRSVVQRVSRLRGADMSGKGPALGLLALGIGRSGEAIFTLLQVRVYTGMLSVSAVGELSLILTIIGFFMQLIVNPTCWYLFRQTHVWLTEGRLGREVKQFAILLLLSIPLIALLVMIGGRLFPNSIGRFAPLGLIVLVAANVCVIGLQQNIVTILNLLNRRVWFVILNNVALLLAVLLSVLFVVWWGRTPQNWQWGYIAAYAILLPASIVPLAQSTRAHAGKHAPLSGGMLSAQSLRFALPLLLVALCYWVQMFGYRMAVAERAGAETVGIFTIGLSLGSMPVLLVTKIANDFLVPHLYRGIASFDDSVRLAAWERFVQHYVPVALISAPITAAAAHFFARILVSPAYWSFAWVGYFGAAFQMLFALYSAYSLLAQAVMRNQLILAPNILASVVIIGGTILLAPRWHLLGPGMALVLGAAVLVGLLAFQLHRLYKPKLPMRALGLSAALGLFGGGILALLGVLLPQPTFMTVFVVLAGTAAYLLAAIFALASRFPLPR